jgi:hypothetical protein
MRKVLSQITTHRSNAGGSHDVTIAGLSSSNTRLWSSHR